jgi:2-dehydropantoate 2-reductase
MPNRSLTKIAVIGAGALGCYFGGMFARAGMTVTLIGRRSHIDAIRKNGLLFESGGVRQSIPVDATEDVEVVRDAGQVLFCVKSSDTEAAARQMAPHLASAAVILSMQNGVDNIERIRRHVAPALAVAVYPVLIYAAAEMAGPGSVRHTGGGNVVGSSDMPDEIAALFKDAGIPLRISDDIDAELWTKLVMNCAYNAICALTGAPYGRMVAVPEIRAVMLDVVNEVAQVAKAKGVTLRGDIGDAAIKLADAMPVTMSSTAQDLRHGKPTEIDHLNGYVVREGEALGIATPVNRTLNALMKMLEQARASR